MSTEIEIIGSINMQLEELKYYCSYDCNMCIVFFKHPEGGYTWKRIILHEGTLYGIDPYSINVDDDLVFDLTDGELIMRVLEFLGPPDL